MRARIAAVIVALAIAAYFAPIVAGGGLHHHSLTSQMVAQARDPAWPVWREGWDSVRYEDVWFTRRLLRTTFRPVSATFAHLFAGRLHARPQVYFGLLVAAHLAATLLVFRVARRFASAAPAALSALVFGLHPAAANVLAGGKFPDFALGGAFGVATLACLLRARDGPGRRRRWAALAAGCALAATFSEESFVALAPIAALWVLHAPGAPGGFGLRDGLRLSAPAAAAALVAACAQAAHWASSPRGRTYRHFDGQVPIEAGDRLLRAVVDPYLYARHLFVWRGAGKEPWLEDGASFQDLSPYGPLHAGALALVLAALALGALRSGMRGRALAGALAAPIALAWVEPVATRALGDFSRWPSLRQVYFPAAFVAWFVALSLGALERRGRVARAAGLAGGAAVVAWLAATGAGIVRDGVRFERDARATIDRVSGVMGAIPPDSRVHFLGHRGGVVPNAVWLSLGAGAPRLAATPITMGDDGAPEIYTRLDARTLEIRRADGAPFGWLRPPPDLHAGLRDRARAFLLAAARKSYTPGDEPRFAPGLEYDIAGMDGDAVVVSEIAGGVPTVLQLRLARSIDDPRTVLIAWPDGAPRRLRCPRDGAPCAAD